MQAAAAAMEEMVAGRLRRDSGERMPPELARYMAPTPGLLRRTHAFGIDTLLRRPSLAPDHRRGASGAALVAAAARTAKPRSASCPSRLAAAAPGEAPRPARRVLGARRASLPAVAGPPSSGTLDELLAELVRGNVAFRDAFLATFREHMEPGELVARLEREFCAHDGAGALARRHRVRVLRVLREWARRYARDDGVLDRIRSFGAGVAAELPGAEVLQAAGELARAEQEERPAAPTLPEARAAWAGSGMLLSRALALRVPRDDLVAAARVTAGTLDGKSGDIAARLSRREAEIYLSLRPLELAGFDWMRRDGLARCAGVAAYVGRFNRVSYWAAASVLARDTDRARRHAVRKLVKVAVACERAGNFHGMFEVLAGLQVQAVYRLHRAEDCIGGRTLRAAYARVMALFSSDSNYGAYRAELRRRGDGEALPHMGVVLKDLAALRERPARSASGVIDFARSRAVAETIESFLRHQAGSGTVFGAGHADAAADALDAETEGADRDETLLMALSSEAHPVPCSPKLARRRSTVSASASPAPARARALSDP